ncbi:hypothetical protein ACIBEJ_00495 [Nonomuraea sp. NPDC050790]|uniref:hypothetical protein n=1 Tax=Nonomuraea sp. NPDC050790 TaxID=3364371 RepID=UPI0037A823E4
MPVTPIPCTDGGGPITVEGCCSPSITAVPWCLADGTPIAVLAATACGDCGDPAAPPTLAGWLNPQTGVFTAGVVPAGAQPCTGGCADVVAVQRCDDTDGDGQPDLTYTELWCVDDDGTSSLIVIFATDPGTPYTPVAPVGCAPDGCIDTICRQLCDDTDGDGQADATYSELWCVRADGTTSLILTYAGDPGVPYTPVSPVECTYGCPTSETVMLCDDTGPFLRRYTFLNGSATYEDVALDGQTPHVATGTVGACPAAADCSSPTTPTATVGLCLADGTPIAVVLTRGCDGVTSQDGWINLATGTFSTGDPPAGARACGDSRAFELTGVLCDTDTATGDILGLVLVQYTYNPDGSLASVQLLDPATGDPYVLQGELRTCPGGDDVPEQDLVVLCDVAADGSVTAFLRDYRRDATGAINGHTDSSLLGTPYTPTGAVGLCQPAAEQAHDVESYPLCVIDNASGNVLQHIRREVIYDQSGMAVGERFVDAVTGGPVAIPGGAHLGICPHGPLTVIPDLFHGELLLCDDAGPFVRKLVQDAAGAVTAVVNLTLDGASYAPVGAVGVCAPEPQPCRDSATLLLCDLPSGGQPAAAVADTSPTPYEDLPGSDAVAGGAAVLWSGGTLTIPADTAPSGDGFPQRVRTFAATVQAPRPGCDTGTATVTASIQVERTGPDPGCGGTGFFRLLAGGTLLASQGIAPSNVPVGTVQTLTVTAQVPAADLAAGDVAWFGGLETYHRSPASCPGGSNGDGARIGGWVVDAFSVTVVFNQAGCATQVLASVVNDCESGQVVSVTYALPDGTPYTPTGTIGQCTPASTPDPAEPCRNSSTLLVCDLPTGGEPDAVVTDTDPTPYYPFPVADPVEDAQALWDGGTLDLPPGTSAQPGTTGRVNTAAATIQAPRPDCDTGTAHVSVSLTVQQTGPDDGCGPTGHLRLFNGTTQIALTVTPVNTPAGYFAAMTVDADVPAADLAASNITFALALDSYDDSPATCAPSPRRTGWQLSGFTTRIVYDQTGCEKQILRTITIDCASGAVLAVTDTTLDGQPYTVTGQVGQCVTAGGGTVVEPCADSEIVPLCDLTYDPQAPIPTPASDFTLTGNVVAANDGTTLWFAQANQPANGVAELTVSGLLPATQYEFRFASAWIGAGAPDPANNNAIYLLEILDGTTVLATRTRNTSNGSNVFPGGVLTEDLPPLAFIAPATGAVTIRFTDQTTGGPVNDRDLYLMPLEVRTAVLTVNSTPFLRRFTFDCAGGLTATQDVSLDGTTPYDVQGEPGHCTADGAAVPAVTPCGVQNVLEACRCDDTNGDGLADTDYLELIGVDCEGITTPLGTFLPDLSAPYEPVAPTSCDATADGADPPRGVQARRVQLAPGQSWDAAGVALLQSVTATAHGDNAEVTTADGTSTLFTSETATWSVVRPDDAALTGPLTITALTAPVTLTYTIGVQL